MKIYTRSGDGGETGLFRGPRVRKDAPRIEAYGTVDELNAAIGVARSQSMPAEIDSVLKRVQHDLFCVGAQLATPGSPPEGMPTVTAGHVADLEGAIDHWEQQAPPLNEFVLPEGCPAAALLHLARTVGRRAERQVVSLAGLEATVSPQLLAYLNRLGDLLFVLARAANAAAGRVDAPWDKQGGHGKPSPHAR